MNASILRLLLVRRGWSLLGLVVSAVAGGWTSVASAASRPNIIVIMCDDLGYGDVQANFPQGLIRTPNLDRVAKEGVRFTDAYAPSGLCTPTRYGLMTGRYAWRTRLQSGVVGGLSPRLIEAGRPTVASLLKAQGYRTAVIGKWHLGLNWEILPGKAITELGVEAPDQVWNVDYRRPFGGGPTTLGFDRFFGISASLDMVPYTYLENDRVVALPTEERTWPMHPGYVFDCRLGPAAPGFEVADVLPELTRQAERFIEEGARREEPFFLYLPLPSPHTPLAPTAEWKGRSGLNLYADFVMQTDAAIGQLLATLERSGEAENTLLIVTSDNGCAPQARIHDLKAKGHDVSGGLRGNKADLYDGGVRVPFLVRWPERVRPAVSGQLVCLTDLFATFAEVVGARVPHDAAEDSFSFASALLARAPVPGQPVRDAVVLHSAFGSFAIREGDWKLALCAGSGGWSAPVNYDAEQAGLPMTQLYHIGGADRGERNNLEAQQPERVQRLESRLREIVAAGRSTPGPQARNAVEIALRKPSLPSQRGRAPSPPVAETPGARD